MRKCVVVSVALAMVFGLFSAAFAQGYVLKSCGEVISITKDEITLMVSEKEKSFKITENTKIYSEDRAKPIDLKNIKKGEIITIITEPGDKNNTALEIEKGPMKIQLKPW
jgi:hypothetical protein